MNKELRKIRNAVNNYVVLLAEHPEEVREHYKDYISDVERLSESVENYINSTSDLFQTWCESSVEVFGYEESNFFQQIYKKINMEIVNHYLNRYSYELSVCGIFQDTLNIISKRLVNYEIFN